MILGKTEFLVSEFAQLRMKGIRLELRKCLKSEEYVYLAVFQSKSGASACAGVQVFQFSYKVQIHTKTGHGDIN